MKRYIHDYLMDTFKLINRGNMAEQFVGLELIKGHKPHLLPQLYYWHREARSSNAEVDYVIQKDDIVVPVEVKSGHRGPMQSMRIFINERDLPFGIRLSQENFSKYDKIISMPIYSAFLIPDDDRNYFLNP